MKLETKDKYFREVVSELKSFGFEVWAPEDIFEDTFRYGWVTDGIHILYFQINDLEGLQWSTECIPSHETGSGLSIDIPYPLTRDEIISAFKIPFGIKWSNFQLFKEHHRWQKIIQI